MSGNPDRDELLLQAGLSLSSALSLDAVLHRIVELAVELTGARYGALGIVGEGDRIVEFVTEGVSDEERRAIGPPPTGGGILGVLIADAEPLRLRSIQDDPRSVGFPPNHPPMRSFLGAPVKARGEVFGNIYLTEKRDADEFSTEDEDTLVVLAAQAGVAVANARLYEEAERRGRWLQASHEVLTTILGGAPSDTVLSLVAARARELASAATSMIALPRDEDAGHLAIVAADGTHADELLGTQISVEHSLSGEVIRKGEPIVLEDAAADDRADPGPLTIAEAGPAIFIPLRVRGTVFGTLALMNRAGGASFDAGDVGLVEVFAAQASVALELSRAQEELQRLSLMDDRERIAKELHDGVIQSLFAVGMGLQGTALLIGDETLSRRIEGAVEELDRVILDLRNYIFGLRPGILAGGRLDVALRQLAEEFEGKTGIVTVVDVDARAAAALAPHAEDAVQLAREALSNVGRHAGATTVRLALRQEEGVVVLLVDDDGHGFDVQAATGAGSGLVNMTQRATRMGGNLDISSVPGDGSTLRLVIPV